MASIKLNIIPFSGTADSTNIERRLFADRFLFWFFILTIFSIILQVLLIGFAWHSLPPFISLFYSRPWGDDILAKPIFFLILPVFSILVLLVNLIFSTLVARDNKFLNRIFAFTSLFVSMAILFDIFKIITLLI